MQIIEEIKNCQKFSLLQKKQGKSIGFIPTMGGLHKGHLELIKTARNSCDIIIVSLFLNPLQFSKNEDLDKYPSNLVSDFKLCKNANVDVLLTPSIEQMYGKKNSIEIRENELSKNLCGISRPTHFTGVITVISKLFNITLPDKAFFGEKDYQQLCIIRRLVKNLNFPIEIISVPIVRQEDGLALSTRNQYLTDQQRQKACIIFQQLKYTKEKIIKNKIINVEETMQFISKNVKKMNLKIDYIQICHHQNLQPLSGDIAINTAQLFIAVFCGSSRLIDNIFLGL